MQYETNSVDYEIQKVNRSEYMSIFPNTLYLDTKKNNPHNHFIIIDKDTDTTFGIVCDELKDSGILIIFTIDNYTPIQKKLSTYIDILGKVILGDILTVGILSHIYRYTKDIADLLLTQGFEQNKTKRLFYKLYVCSDAAKGI